MSDRTWDEKHEAPCLEPAPKPDRGSAQENPRRVDAVGAIVGNALVLAIANSYATWGPWTGGVITASFADVVWAVNLTCIVTMAGNGLLLLVPSWRLKRAVDLLNNAASIVSTALVLAVFPFAFVRIGLSWVDVVLSIVLVVALFALAVTLCVRLVRGLSA
jgi:hypothetical protein